MTHKEENIVNIAMRASELLQEGKIERDDMTGHSGLTAEIIALAEKFESLNAEVDYDSTDRDYWIEIDDYAEKQLLELYGVDKKPVKTPVNVKVIVESGIVDAVLKDRDAPISVEVVDIDSDYPDYEQLSAYKRELYEDPSFISCDYTVTEFSTEHSARERDVCSTLEEKIQSASLRQGQENRDLDPLRYDFRDTVISSYDFEDGINKMTICSTNPVGESSVIISPRTIITSGMESQEAVMAMHKKTLELKNHENHVPLPHTNER